MNLPLDNPIVAKHFENPASHTDTLMDEIFHCEIYAPLFKDKKDLMFLDIGANIGLVSIYAYDSCKRIVAVEPSPQTFEVLKAMTAKFPKIECVQAALAPEDGPSEFFVNNENTTASSTVNTFGDFIEVPGLTLPSILKLYQLGHIDVCKLDCEGAESGITTTEFSDLSNVVDCWWIEVHNTPDVAWQAVLSVIQHILIRCGYKTQDINGMRLIARK